MDKLTIWRTSSFLNIILTIGYIKNYLLFLDIESDVLILILLIISYNEFILFHITKYL